MVLKVIVLFLGIFIAGVYSSSSTTLSLPTSTTKSFQTQTTRLTVTSRSSTTRPSTTATPTSTTTSAPTTSTPVPEKPIQSNFSLPVIKSNTSILVVASNEIFPNRFTAFLDDEELIIAGRESIKVLVKALRSNRSIDEALTIAVTTFATSRTANRIKEKSLKNSKFSLDKEFDVTKSLSSVALGSLAVFPPYFFPKYFRSMDENWLNENRQIQKFLTNTIIGTSE